MYTGLHNHTDYSNAMLGFPDSVNKTEELIQRAYDLGLRGISITDHEGISNHIIANKYFHSMQLDRPFTLTLGNEIYLMSEQEDVNNRDNKSDLYTPYYHFLLNSLDMIGHKQIRKLSSRAWFRAYTYKGLMRRPTYYKDLEEIVGSNKGHVIGSSACLGGYLPKEILKWKLEGNQQSCENVQNFVKWCINVFGQDCFYLEVQPCNEDNQEQIIVNKTLMEIGTYLGIKLIVTTDSHYYSKDSAMVHETLLKSKEGDREVGSFYATAYLMGEQELRDYLLNCFTDEQIDEMFANTNEIANRVQEYNFEHSPMIPQIPIEKIPRFNIAHRYKEYYDKYEDFKFYSQLDNIQDSYFFYRIECALDNLVEQKGKDVETYISRLNSEFHELRLISEAFDSSMASYYVAMSKIIELIWDCDSLSMPARGSGAGFLVCYLLEITQIDPVPLGDYFPFWRHLSAERGVEIADIDNDSQNSKRDDIIEAIRNYFGDDRVLNVATFSKLTSKTAIEKACKGLGISDDTSGYLKSLIPVERGNIWSLKDCFNGNEDKGRRKVSELIKEVSKYPYLKESMFTFEGLVIGRGIHASGVLIGNEPYVNQISVIRSPNNVLCSCYDLHDAEYCGWTKVDILTIVASDKIRKTMDLLVEHGHMEWQGSLKATYWKYLHPDVIDYTNPKMWNMIQKIYGIFQFDTPIAVKSLNEVKPQSIMDLSATNSLLRLMAQDGKEAPLSRYRRYKENIQNWYDDMTNYGLNQDEQEVLKHYLSNSYGLAESQEKVMMLSMDKKISGFSLKQANKLRKAIAKKKADVLEETKELFFNSCKECGTRDIMAKYIWEEEFAMSFGYSFSQLHSYSYSVIAVQELNLNYYYPTVYWNTACLTIDSQSDENNERSKNTQYGKVAKSIYKMIKFGTTVQPPNINKSEIGFTPIEEDNSIIFGMGGISGINQEIAKQIIDNRPYSSFEDFYKKNKFDHSLVTKSKMANLIKGGCFDSLNPNRVNVMKWFCVYENPKKKSLTMSNLPQAIAMGINFPQELKNAYTLKQGICSKQYFYCVDPLFKSKKHYIVEPKYMLPYLEQHYLNDLQEEQDYYYDGDNMIIIDKSLDKAIKKDINKLKELLNTEEVLKEYNTKMLENAYMNMIGVEDVNKWSFEATSFYHNGQHELDGVDLNKYNVSNFSDLPEEPIFVEKSNRGRTWKQYELYRICGTVLDRKDNNHLVDILTNDNEVVTVNVPRGAFGYYKQTIEVNGVKDANWLSRGNIIMVSGYRRGDSFFAKKYKNSLFQHTITLVKNINEDKSLDIQLERLIEEE